jgi:hypothetical protein
MSGFAPGDMVVCVDARSPAFHVLDGQCERNLRAFLVEGRHYVVEGVLEMYGQLGLQLVGQPRDIDTDCYQARRFRKIDKSDEGFAAWMRSLRPIPAKHNRKVEA